MHQTIMKNQLAVLVIVTSLMASCGLKQENETLVAKIDSLNTELAFQRQMSAVLENVGVLLDSIDNNRNALKVNMEMGTTYDDFNTRLSELNQYVKDSEKKIDEMEKSLAKSNSSNKTYSNSIARLKKQLEDKTAQIAQLEATVAEYKEKNEQLGTLVELQNTELEDKSLQIEAKRQELTMLETRITELLTQSKVSQADSYFLRAQAAEEAARRTQLAPKKKKESYKEALDLYQKAFDLGREDAKAKIEEISNRLK
jgi:chromosome segregation ATPase